ncbi:DUF2235 domain-containing protein [Bradyrhizobium sp. BRP23]|uniref:T6SS phospholipase effector Tle1-like catalytic domain-containing protein n=1 Tax=Bradyrhizobium sp. BRP23 TaxID=2793820 RepID=UPI001CD5498C|nr:DUF2235 domain-containing protein [Bradyrhizobium sp. BRP23]MCA1379833.1 DUF2235 domain-containing protein [Bradyrhizobium sp. BRP05]MCA1420153.1 DUF2235 domain-containing protein [Bradyrhizobium sp. BRP23]
MSKTMIFLMDGTANDATEIISETETCSNVYAINQLIADHKQEGNEISTQVTFYLPGVGTKFTVSAASIFSEILLRKTQYIFGDNLDQLVLRAYVNLVANYRVGDEIILIGFSRGAAAARIFSRLISDFGILKSGFLTHLDRMWRDFIAVSEKEDDTQYYRAIEDLKKNLAEQCESDQVFHEAPKIKFMGLFDTVTGPFDRDIGEHLIARDQKPASNVSSIVHLLSMHENRAEFPPRRFAFNGTCELREIWLPTALTSRLIRQDPDATGVARLTRHAIAAHAGSRAHGRRPHVTRQIQDPQRRRFDRGRISSTRWALVARYGGDVRRRPEGSRAAAVRCQARSSGCGTGRARSADACNQEAHR